MGTFDSVACGGYKLALAGVKISDFKAANTSPATIQLQTKRHGGSTIPGQINGVSGVSVSRTIAPNQFDPGWNLQRHQTAIYVNRHTPNTLQRNGITRVSHP